MSFSADFSLIYVLKMFLNDPKSPRPRAPEKYLEPGQADKSEGAEGCRARAKPTGGLEPSPPEPSIEPTRAHHRCSGGNAPRGHSRGDLGGGSPNGGDPPISPLEPTSGLGGRGGGGADDGQATQARPTPRAGNFLSTFGTPLTLIYIKI